MNILVINGHKFYPFAQGKLNMTMFDEIIRLVSPNNEIKTTIVEQGYDVQEEIDKFLWANLIIFQTPVNWFSVPWLLKKYIDEVYQYGVFYQGSAGYGEGGLLTGKRYMYSLTWNSPCEAFQGSRGFFDGRDVDDIIIALHKLQEFCGMTKIKTFSIHDVVKNPNIEKFKQELDAHIKTNVLSGF